MIRLLDLAPAHLVVLLRGGVARAGFGPAFERFVQRGIQAGARRFHGCVQRAQRIAGLAGQALLGELQRRKLPGRPGLLLRFGAIAAQALGNLFQVALAPRRN